MRRTIMGCAACVAVMSGCNQPESRMNAPPHGMPENVHEMQGTYTYMADNALLADMSISDMHFLPHRAQLTSQGEQRVERLAELMRAYGGTLRLSSRGLDAGLLSQRAAAVRARLAECGVDTTQEVLVQDMPGGAGMDAAQAILIRKELGVFKPTKEGAAGGLPSASAGASGDTP